MKASVANSIHRSSEYLQDDEVDLALASIAGLADHLENLSMRQPGVEGAEEFTRSELRELMALLRSAAFGILAPDLPRANEALKDATALLRDSRARDAVTPP